METFGLTIKPAAEYAAAEINAVVKIQTRTNLAINLINTVIQPKIEDMVAHPEKYKSNPYSASFDGPDIVELFDTIRDLLVPLGYEVRDTHDGGMKQVMVVIWKKPMSVKRSPIEAYRANTGRTLGRK